MIRRYCKDCQADFGDPDGIFEDEHTTCPVCGASHNRMEAYDTDSGWLLIASSILALAIWVAVFYAVF